MIKDSQKNLLIEAWSKAHKGETFRLLATNNTTDQNSNLIEALRNFERAIEENPNFIWAIAHKGLANRELGNLDEAISDFQNVINNVPDSPWGYAQLGDTYRQKMARTSNPDALKKSAIDNFKRAIDLYSGGEYAWAHAHLGATYCLLGSIYSRREDWEQAKISLDTAIDQTKQSYAWAYAYMAVVEFKGFNNVKKALEYYDIARALDPRVFSHLNYQIGLLYYLNGEFDKALETYTQELQQETDKSFAIYGIAVTKIRQKGLNEAQTEIGRARQELNQKADVFALYKLAALATLEGQIDQGLDYLQQAKALRDHLIATVNESLRGEFVNLANNDLSWLGMDENRAFQELILKSHKIEGNL